MCTCNKSASNKMFNYPISMFVASTALLVLTHGLQEGHTLSSCADECGYIYDTSQRSECDINFFYLCFDYCIEKFSG